MINNTGLKVSLIWEFLNSCVIHYRETTFHLKKKEEKKSNLTFQKTIFQLIFSLFLNFYLGKIFKLLSFQDGKIF